MLVYVEHGAASVCMTGLPGGSAIVTALGPVPRSVAPDAIEPEAGSARIRRGEPDFSILTGQVGAEVTGVTLVLDDGSSIETTVANGWFAAWWPGSPGVRSAAITTASGTTTQRLNTPALPQGIPLKFFACMRSHGLPNFPAPAFSGGGASPHVGKGSALEPHSPRFKAAQKACRSVLPGHAK
jgi:hypothetical protein